MKKLILAALVLISVSTSATAFAAPTACTASDPKGTVCWGGNPLVLKTSCGGGVHITGQFTNAGFLDDNCAKATQGPKDKVKAQSQQQEKTKAQ
jgi:hypothetical protein